MLVWRLTDGKPGHENQTLGLVAALQRRGPVQCHDIAVDRATTGVADLLLRRFPPGSRLPAPDLLLGAGHATHLPLLAARRAHGGRTVVLMRPSLPLGLFDLCLIPEHDNPPRRRNVLATRGALNPLTATGDHCAERQLVLLGGPSRHFGWDQSALIAQLCQLFQRSPGIHFTVTGSRRTPASLLGELQARAINNCDIVPLQETGPGWVAERLAGSAVAWITEDSVSMLYEALTAGCQVGLLKLPWSRPGRVSRGVEWLVDEGWVTPFERWSETGRLSRPPPGFNEADRCAGLIMDRWWRVD